MNTPPRPGKIITFYSYKGGTGRSMALANVAWILASSGQRVLVMDWDLEAPGIHRYIHPFLQDKELTSSEGVIDFVIDFAAEAASPPDSPGEGESPTDEWYVPYANVLRYASSLDWTFPQNGTLDFVPAGRQGPDYATRVNSFNWQNFYERLGGGVFLEAAKQSMSGYDYVLIDSRTGVSDTSGVCTVQMPDALAVCFTYNVQSIEGAAAVAESAHLQRKRQDGEPGLKIFPVPTRVELAEKQKLEAAREAARERFDPFLWHIPEPERELYWGRVELLYQPFYAYEEVLATFGDKPLQTKSLLASIEAVTDYLTDGAVTAFPPLPEPQRKELLDRYTRAPKPASPENEWLRFAPRPAPLSDTQRWHVYLSYRSTQRAWVLSLYDVLRSLGYEVFLDQLVSPGGNFSKNLDEALDSSQTAILVWSDDARDSHWVQAEYERIMMREASDKAFRYVPVTLDNTRPPLFASRTLFIDFSEYLDGPNGGALLRLLYALVGAPLSVEAVKFATEQDEAAKVAAAKIRAAISNGYPERLVMLFEQGGLPWQTSAVLGCQAAEGLISLNRLDEALQMLERVEARFPRAVRPKQLRALALVRRGKDEDIMNAQEVLGELIYKLERRDPETLGIYARTWMDRYRQSGDTNHLKQARDLYVEAFEADPSDHYTGVNAASMSVLLEDFGRADEYAARVEEIVGTEPRRGDYWATATMAEIALIQHRYEKAGRLYEAAVAMARTQIGSHQSTWRQACLLMERLRPTQFERAWIRKPFEHLPDC